MTSKLKQSLKAKFTQFIDDKWLDDIADFIEKEERERAPKGKSVDEILREVQEKEDREEYAEKCSKIEKAKGSLEYCRAMILFNPLTGETNELWQESQDNQDLYEACSTAIISLDKFEEADHVCLLAAKLNVIDLVKENLRLFHKLQHCEMSVKRLEEKLKKEKPCGMCETWELHNVQVREIQKHYEWPKTYLYNNCPNCGRELRKENKK